MADLPVVMGGAGAPTRAQLAEAKRRREYHSHEHVDGRARAMKTATPMTKCARCRLPLGRDLIERPDLIEYDHRDDRDGYLGLSHQLCNRRAAGRKAQAMARAAGQQAQPRGYVPVWEW
jgi:hypothetical protein